MERRDTPRAHHRTVYRLDTAVSGDSRLSRRGRGGHAKAERRPDRESANGGIKIFNDNPLLHFPNTCRRLKGSDVERKSSSISAPRHRPTPSPCSSKQYYYFGHRIRPRVRPLGRVSEATSGE